MARAQYAALEQSFVPAQRRADISTHALPMLASFAPAFRQEARENLRLALPLIAAQIAGVGMGAVDTIFAGRLGPQALAAVALGVNLNTLFFIGGMGLLMACSPIVAQRLGGGAQPTEIGAFVRRARRFALLVGTAWFAVLNLIARPVLERLNQAPDTIGLAVDVARTLSFSAFGISLWFAQRFCAEGVGHTRPVLVAGVLGLACNALLDWLLLFGHWGAPRLGVIGCGVATSLSSLLMAGVLALYWRYASGLGRYLAAPRCAAREGARAILRLGLPIAGILLAEGGLFVLTALLMAGFGEQTVAAYQVAINFASLVFMIPVGVAQATTVRVGFAAGAGARGAARYRGAAGMGLGLLNAASNASIMALFPAVIVSLYTEDADIARLASRFLLLAAVFQFFDGLQATANGALRGIKDTRVPMAITLFAYWCVGLPVAWWLAFHTALGAVGLWWGLTAGLGAAALGLSLRFARQTRPPAGLAQTSMI
jgi:MATE family multidrug resistance protein